MLEVVSMKTILCSWVHIWSSHHQLSHSVDVNRRYFLWESQGGGNKLWNSNLFDAKIGIGRNDSSSRKIDSFTREIALGGSACGRRFKYPESTTLSFEALHDTSCGFPLVFALEFFWESRIRAVYKFRALKLQVVPFVIQGLRILVGKRFWLPDRAVPLDASALREWSAAMISLSLMVKSSSLEVNPVVTEGLIQQGGAKRCVRIIYSGLVTSGSIPKSSKS